MAKKKVNLWVEETVWEEFKRLAFQKHENFHGALTCEVEEALLYWIGMHTQNHTKNSAFNGGDLSPRVQRVFLRVKEYMRERFGYVALPSGQRVPRRHLVEAIANVRGSDPRTVKKWLKVFEQFKLIRWVGGEIWEVS